MQQELPLYIFIRNSIILCFAFFIISSVIIERGRQERGENSIFIINIIKKDKNNVYKNNNGSNSQGVNAIPENSDPTFPSDSIANATKDNFFSSNLVDNKNLLVEFSDKVDL